MPMIQRTKSASNSGQQSDIASTTIARAPSPKTAIAIGRKLVPPIETLLLLPLITTAGLSAFFTVSHLLVIFGPICRWGLPNPQITKKHCSLILLFHTSANPTSHNNRLSYRFTAYNTHCLTLLHKHNETYRFTEVFSM